MTLESDKPIKIGNFHPVQIKVAKTGKYRELTDETYNMQSVQTVAASKQYFEGSGNFTKEFDEEMNGLSIYNGHTEIMRFVIDGVSIPVFPKGTWEGIIKESFRGVNIIASGPWYVMPLQTIGAAASIVEPEPPDTEAPDNVTNLAPSNVTQNSATLTWTASVSSDTAGYQVWRGGSMLTTVTGLVYNATGMTASTQYTYTIKAVDHAGNVASGTSVNVTTAAQPSDTTPPNNVTGLDKSNVTQTGVTLTWQASDSSDVKDYRIYQGSTLIATVTGLSYGVTGLTPDTSYSFTVKARDTSNNEAAGTTVSVKTAAPADTTAPILTITPAATFADTLQVTMSANEPVDIFYSLDESAPTVKYTTLLTLTDTTTLKAFARDLAGNESAVQTVVYTKDTQAPPDTTPPVLTITPNGGSFTSAQTVMMSTNEPGSPIYYTTNGVDPTESDSLYSNPIAVSASTTLKARAKDAAGNWSAVQTVTFTITVPDTTPPEPVTALTAGTPTATTIPISWALSPSGDVTVQEVAYGTDGVAYTMASGSVNPSSTSFTLENLTSETGYWIRVVAIDGAGNRSTAVTVQASTAADVSMTVTANPPSGVYSSATAVTLSTNVEGGTIRWAADGAEPTITSPVFTGTPINWGTSGTIRAIVVDGLGVVSKPFGFYYIISDGATGGHYSFTTISQNIGLRISGLKFDQVSFDVNPKIDTGSSNWQYYINLAVLTAGAYFARNNSGKDEFGAAVQSVSVNGIPGASGTAFVTPNVRQTILLTLKAEAVISKLASGAFLHATNNHLNADVYGIKFLHTGVVVADFDFTRNQGSGATVIDTISATTATNNGTWVAGG